MEFTCYDKLLMEELPTIPNNHNNNSPSTTTSSNSPISPYNNNNNIDHFLPNSSRDIQKLAQYMTKQTNINISELNNINWSDDNIINVAQNKIINLLTDLNDYKRENENDKDTIIHGIGDRDRTMNKLADNTPSLHFEIIE